MFEDISKTDLYMKYLGAMSLLGRVGQARNEDDEESLKRAFEDANRFLALAESDQRFKPASPGCYGLFEVKI